MFGTCVIIMIVITFSVLNGFVYIFLNRKYEPLLLAIQKNEEKDGDVELDSENDENFKMSDILNFDKRYWLICIGSITTTCTYYVFMSFSTDYYQFRYNLDYSIAKNYASATSGVAMVGMVVFSTFTGKYGKKGYLLVVSSCLAVFTYAFMYLVDVGVNSGMISAIFPVFMIGLYFSMYQSCYWSAIVMITEKKAMAVAFGSINALDNIGLSLYPIMFGAINKIESLESY